jgi:hypothetical protein
MHPNGKSDETEASVARVKAWKEHRVGRRPPFRDYKAYYQIMRWGPFSYWTWRGIAILVCAAVILYAVVRIRHALTWFGQP